MTHEVSVSYFKNEWQSVKYEKYDEAKANEMFTRTCNKYKDLPDQLIIVLREQKNGEWDMLKSESFNFKFETTKKKKKK